MRGFARYAKKKELFFANVCRSWLRPPAADRDVCRAQREYGCVLWRLHAVPIHDRAHDHNIADCTQSAVVEAQTANVRAVYVYGTKGLSS